MARELRNTAHEIFAHALSDSSIDRAFERHVFYDRGILRIVEDLYDLSSYARVFVVAIGKAAHTMVESLMGRIGPGAGISGIVCAPVLPQTQVFGFKLLWYLICEYTSGGSDGGVKHTYYWHVCF